MNQTSNATIVRLGTAVPKQEVTQAEALDLSREIICENDRQVRLMKMLLRKSGVNSRRTVIPWDSGEFWELGNGIEARGPATGDRVALYDRYAPVLAAESCRQALGLAEEQVNTMHREQLPEQDLLRDPDGVQSSSMALQTDPTTIDPRSVTHLVTVSCTGFAAPGFDWRWQMRWVCLQRSSECRLGS